MFSSEDVSRRLAVCNMDWDRVRAVDIFILLNSWKPANGVIKSVTIYPSEYGLKQIELRKTARSSARNDQNRSSRKISKWYLRTRWSSTSNYVCRNGKSSGQQSEVEAEEEPEDPEIKSDDDDDNINPQTFNEDDDPDTTDPATRERLRKYQLNRLKYYYAVVECDTVENCRENLRRMRWARVRDQCRSSRPSLRTWRRQIRFFDSSPWSMHWIARSISVQTDSLP